MKAAKPLLDMQAQAPRMPKLGEYGPVVGEIINDLVLFAIAQAQGRATTARAALASARMRLDELWGRFNAGGTHG